MTDSDHPYPLAIAVEKFLPGWSVASLLTERRKGRLRVGKIAGKLCTTESAIREMQRLCLEEQKVHVSIFDGIPDASVDSGSSRTEASKLALAAAKATLQELKQRSRATSQTSTRRRKKLTTSNVSLLRTS